MSVSKVFAGKFRRYANLKWYQHIKHIFISYIPNIFDAFKFCIGIIQSVWKIAIFRPDVVFIKGGYVGLPVGLAAVFLRRPIVLHDSDAIPGLTNRILSKYATKVGLGMPQEDSGYDSKKTEYVGIPIDKRYSKTNDSEKVSLRDKYASGSDLPAVLAMGGSQGSTVINKEIIESYPNVKGQAIVYLITGSGNYDSIKRQVDEDKRQFIGLKILPFVSGDEMFDLVGLSDIVVTRAGATTIAELAATQKATIIIPSPYLSSDHQTKNAELLKKTEAAIVINQSELESDFLPKLQHLLSDPEARDKLGKNLSRFASNNAAEKMADIIIKVESDAKK